MRSFDSRPRHCKAFFYFVCLACGLIIAQYCVGYFTNINLLRHSLKIGCIDKIRYKWKADRIAPYNQVIDMRREAGWHTVCIGNQSLEIEEVESRGPATLLGVGCLFFCSGRSTSLILQLWTTDDLFRCLLRILTWWVSGPIRFMFAHLIYMPQNRCINLRVNGKQEGGIAHGVHLESIW